MKLFLDTADVAQIREVWSWGIIDGVTTNPSHVAKTGRPAAAVFNAAHRLDTNAFRIPESWLVANAAVQLLKPLQ